MKRFNSVFGVWLGFAVALLVPLGTVTSSLGASPTDSDGADDLPTKAKPRSPKLASVTQTTAHAKPDQKRGWYDHPITVTFTSDTKGAAIFYTTNGATPSEASGIPYQNPITLSMTTVLRTVATKPGLAPSEVHAYSYIFPAQVIDQTGAGFPTSWGQTNGVPVVSYYLVKSQAGARSTTRDALAAALRALPTVSISADQASLFDNQSGIYANPKENGSAWERPASVELIYPDGRAGFQINCGLRTQGGWNRKPAESPKHSFRLVFKKEYGPRLLRFPLFGADGAQEFSTVILRGGNNNSWLHWSAEERRRADYARDEWMRDTLRAMKHPSARGFFVHLYLNGLYWGVYDLTERPSAPFVAANEGGSPEDYESRKGEKLLSGDHAEWNHMLALANAGLETAAKYERFKPYLDLPEFIDYMIANFYGANADWDHSSNWYAARRRDTDGPFQFFIWDGERTLEGVRDDSIDYDDDQSPPRLFHKLSENPEFRLLFADRVQRHLFDGGALTPERAAERYQRRAQELAPAVVAEAARWGSYRKDIHPYRIGPFEDYDVEQHCKPEIKRLLTEYFPQRTAVVIEQFQRRHLFPQIAAPAAKLDNGQISLNAPAGTIYYCLESGDPRLPGGQLAPTAQKYSAPFAQKNAGKIKARALVGALETGEWSALKIVDPRRIAENSER